MRILLLCFGFVMLIISILMLIDPELMFRFVEDNLNQTSLYIGAIIGRIVFGLLLVKAASISKFPLVIKIFGFLVIIAALSFIIMGHHRFQDFISAVLPMFSPYGRLTAVFVMAFGGFIIYAFLGDKELDKKD